MSRRTDVARLARQRYWRQADARIMVEAWRRSGQTQAEFAHRHGIDPKRIARWSWQLGRSKAEPVRFHPVRLAGGAPGIPPGSIEIQLVSGRRVRLEHGFEPEDLRRVLAVLQEEAEC